MEIVGVNDHGEEIKVVFYSGYKGQETPRAVILAGREYPVEKIIWRKRVREKDTGESFELVRCRVAGQEVTLRIGRSGDARLLGPERLLPPA
jgi:hypothetical protein